MTDQVPNFSLPSARTEGGAGRGAVVVRVVKGAARPAAVLGAIALGGWAVKRMVQKAQERQLRDFQSQLQSFSSMLDLDTAGMAEGDGLTDAERAKKVLDAGNRKYKFRTAEAEEEAERIAQKVRLDLFQEDGAPAVGKTRETNAADAIGSVKAETPYEIAVATALNAVEVQGVGARAAAAPLEDARKEAALSVEDAKVAFNTFVSKVVSVQIDKAAAILRIGLGADGQPLEKTMPSEAEAAEGLKHLAGLATTMRSVNEIVQEAGLVTGLAYVGTRAKDENSREELYRSYAVFCLSDEKRVKDDSALQGLLDMQMVLSLSDERAEAVNREIAKGMFQVAVSSAMADGSMSNESKDALDQLKDSFGDFLDGGAADNIVSEVSVMRAMYSLQQLLAEQGVSEEDVAELRKMCADLGVDIDEMMSNADQMGDALGPEAKQFVGGLRALLQDGDSSAMADNLGNIMANAAIDVAADETPAAASTLNPAGPKDGSDGPPGPGTAAS